MRKQYFRKGYLGQCNNIKNETSVLLSYTSELLYEEKTYFENTAHLLLLLLLLDAEVWVSVEAFNDEDVLEDELQQTQEGVGQIQFPQRAIGAYAQSCHHGEVGQSELAQGRRHQEDHIQPTRGIRPHFACPTL